MLFKNYQELPASPVPLQSLAAATSCRCRKNPSPLSQSSYRQNSGVPIFVESVGGIGMAERTIVYWRDIPAQVVVRAGRKRASRELPPRFLTAIDACAMKQGLKQSDAYLDEWRRGDAETCTDDIDDALNEAVAALERSFSNQRLGEIVARGGYLNA
jgi:hypothetical protein